MNLYESINKKLNESVGWESALEELSDSRNFDDLYDVLNWNLDKFDFNRIDSSVGISPDKDFKELKKQVRNYIKNQIKLESLEEKDTLVDEVCALAKSYGIKLRSNAADGWQCYDIEIPYPESSDDLGFYPEQEDLDDPTHIMPAAIYGTYGGKEVYIKGKRIIPYLTKLFDKVRGGGK